MPFCFYCSWLAPLPNTGVETKFAVSVWSEKLFVVTWSTILDIFPLKKDSRSKILLPFLGGGDLRNFPQKFLDIFAQKFQDDSVRKNLDTSAGKFL
jgi:hypothetical protein